MRAGRRRIATLLVGVALLGACGGDDDGDQADDVSTSTSAAGAATTATTAPPEEVCTEERKGGEITMGVGLEIGGMDPTVSLGTGVAGATEMTAMWDTLMRYNPATGEYETHVAESLEPTKPDLTEWTLKLKSGLKFGNGDPLTGDAVKFSIERLAKSTRAAAGLAQEFSAITVVDPLTVRFTMRSPNGSVPYTLAGENGMPINPAVVAAKGENFPKDPTGSGVGPYEFTRWSPGEELVFTAKDDYWGGPVCIETLRFVLVPGGQATLDAFTNGELDMAFLFDQKVINQAREDGNEAYSAISGANGGLLLNNRAGRPTADLRVRQAIAYAVDPKLIDQRVLDGEGRPSNTLIDDDQRISPGVAGPPLDPAKAKALVAAVKAEGWDGKINLVFGDVGTAVDVSIAVEAMLTDVGFTVVRENLPTAEQSQRTIFPPYNYDVGTAGFSIFDAGPIARVNQFLSDSVRNRPGYKNADMDAAIRELQAAVTEDETIEAMGKVQEVWNATIPSVVYAASEWYFAQVPELKGVVYTRDVTAMFHDAYVED